MKGLLTLIKLSKRSLDELRRKMVSLENQKAQLLQASARLKQELQDEIVMASRTPEMGGFFGGFSKRIQKRQLDIADEVDKLDKQMEKLNLEIVEAFSELKKYEIALDQAKQREKDKVEKRENLMLDEIAEQQYHRRKDKGESN